MDSLDAKALLEKAKAFARAETLRLLHATSTTTAAAPITALSVTSYATAVQFPPSFSQQTITAIYATCKTYIGSLHAEIHEPQLRQIFSTYGSIRSLSMSYDPATAGLPDAKHKGYAFLEYDFPESLFMAMEALNGIEFGGKAIRVSRPKDYNIANLELIPKAPAERVFVANIHEIVDEEMIKGIFDAFGPVEKVSFLPDVMSRKHRGCGYVQFKSEISATNAVASIKAQGGLELAGARLNVMKAIVGGDLMAGMQALKDIPEIPETVKLAAKHVTIGKTLNPLLGVSLAPLPAESAAALALKAAVAAAKAKIAEESSSNALDDDDEINLSIDSSRRLDIMQKLMRKEETGDQQYDGTTKRVKLSDSSVPSIVESKLLVLKNMVAVEDSADSELEGEIREECSKYGKVEVVVVCQPENSASETVNVRVHFATVADAVKTRAALHGRYFAGRRITAEFE